MRMAANRNCTTLAACVTEERKFLQEMMVHETAHIATAYLINRSLPNFYCHFILNCFMHALSLKTTCEWEKGIKMKNDFLNLKFSSVFRALNERTIFTSESNASEDEIVVVGTPVFPSTMSRCWLDNLMDRVI